MRFQSRKILVTGADGFIGSHLCEQLVREGARVRAMVYYNAFGHWGWLDDLPQEVLSEIEVVMGDVRDPESTARLTEGCDLIFHLAALIGIPYSYQAPASYLDTNAAGTLHILQAAKRHACERILITSTSEVYGSAQYIPIDESHPRQPQSPYSASKIAADALALSFYHSFQLPVVIARPFNTFGPRQSARAVIPTIITQLLAEKPEIVLGALHPLRDLVFVEDTVEGLIRLALSEKALGREVNIATGENIAVIALAQLLISMIRPGTPIRQDSQRLRPQGSEVDQLLGDPRLLKKVCKWKPAIPLREGLEKTIAWFQEHNDPKRYKTDAYTL
jgi:NAD dependent epimerase/dehydratase